MAALRAAKGSVRQPTPSEEEIVENMADQMMRALAAYRASKRERMQALWQMTADQRCAEMWAGKLTWDQLYEWAARAPHEVPLVNGEFAFIALLTPEGAQDED